MEGTSPNLAFSPPSAEGRARGIPGKGERKGEKWHTSLRQSSWCKCKGMNPQRSWDLGPFQGEHRPWGCPGPTLSFGGLSGILSRGRSPGDFSLDTWRSRPLALFSLLHVVTYPQTCTSTPPLSPKLQSSVSNWPPTSVPTSDPQTLQTQQGSNSTHHFSLLVLLLSHNSY